MFPRLRVFGALFTIVAALVPAGIFTAALLRARAAAPQPASGIAVVDIIRVDGIIGPATARYVLRGIREAEQSGAEALVIELDTPGGLLKSTDDITKGMLNTAVPTVVYVWPHGARAASAGVFITYAATIAAMAPTTHLGAAHPVSLAPGGGGGTEDKTLMTKITNDAVAQIRGFAARRGRNPDWAERAVRESVSITEEQALTLHVINLVADSAPALLAKVDGMEVRTPAGTHRLRTRDARVVEIPMELTEQFLQLLSDPNVGFVLMTIAIYGIIFELSNPGSVFPGVLGGLALILALVSFAVVEVNVAGLILIGFSLILFIADIKVPSHGVLTAGGIASFAIGSLLLTEHQQTFFQISKVLIVTMTVLTGGFFAFAVGAGIRAQKRKVQTGREGLIGAVGVTRTELAPAGTVFVQGELWSAESKSGVIPAGQRVRVLRVDGLRLEVQKEESKS